MPSPKLTLIEQYLFNQGHKVAYSDDPSIPNLDLREFKLDKELPRNRIAELSNFDELTKTRTNNILDFLDSLASKYSDPDTAKSITELDGSLGRACSKLMFFLDEHYYNGVRDEAQKWNGYELEKSHEGVVFRATDSKGQEKYRYDYSRFNNDFDKVLLFVNGSAKVQFLSETQSLKI